MIRTLLSIAAAPAVTLLSLIATNALIRETPPPKAVEPVATKGSRLVPATAVVSFVNRWEPVEEMKPPAAAVPVPEPVTPPAADRPTPTPGSPERAEPQRPPPRRDICARYGGHRQDYVRNHWHAWRCVYPHRS